MRKLSAYTCKAHTIRKWKMDINYCFPPSKLFKSLYKLKMKTVKTKISRKNDGTHTFKTRLCQFECIFIHLLKQFRRKF